MLDSQTAEVSRTGLLRRIAAQDPTALAELYDSLAAPLFSVAIHILGDTREAEEVIQDVFVQIWNRGATFDDKLGAPFHWALGITRNRCIDYLRTRQRRTRLIEEASREADVSTQGEPSFAPPHEVLGEDELASVRAAVRNLPPDQQQAIELAFFGGLTHQEIAEALGEPLGTVKARIRRGMLRLKDSLKEYL